MDRSWVNNYATTDNLRARLASVNRYLQAEGAFGLEFMEPEDVDQKSILNLGCGIGNHDEELVARVSVKPRSYTLVDKSPRMVEEAVQRLRPLIPDVKGVVADIDTLDSNIGPFDVAICMHVLYHVPDPIRSLATMGTLLVPRGLLLATTVSHDTNVELLDIHRNVLRSEFGVEMGDPIAWVFDSANAPNMITDLFEDVTCHIRRAALNFPDTESAVTYYKTLPYYSEAASGAVDTDVLLARVTEGIQDVISSSGRFMCNKDTVTILARNTAHD